MKLFLFSLFIFIFCDRQHSGILNVRGVLLLSQKLFMHSPSTVSAPYPRECIKITQFKTTPRKRSKSPKDLYYSESQKKKTFWIKCSFVLDVGLTECF